MVSDTQSDPSPERQQASWTYEVPDDLRPMLQAALSARNVGPAEIWGEVRDWLEAHGAQVPADLVGKRGTALRS